MLFNREQVKIYLPHREPFLFVDTVNKIEIDHPPEHGPYYAVKELVGAKVWASFYVREDLDIFRGHFPGLPILPGVIQVEMMAQAASFLLTKTFDDINNIDIEVALLGIDHSRFRKPIYPKMQLELYATQTRVRGSIMSYDCTIHHGGELMSEFSVMASVRLNQKTEAKVKS